MNDEIFLPENLYYIYHVLPKYDLKGKHIEDAVECMILLRSFESVNTIKHLNFHDISSYRLQ